MLKVERIEVSGLANALYGMRLPKNSHDKSDTTVKVYNSLDDTIKTVKLSDNDVLCNSDELLNIKAYNMGKYETIVGVNIGEKDMELAERLVLAGTDHGKWLRQVQVSMLITAPMTMFWELDTYKVATVRNSSSRMHKITSRHLTPDDFSWDSDDDIYELTSYRMSQLNHLNGLIDIYNSEDTSPELKKKVFRELVMDLPDSFNFTSTWTASAQTCRAFYFARKNHKQKEMRELAAIFAELPNVGHFITLEK